jgi:outer membrane beta-barrel protein
MLRWNLDQSTLSRLASWAVVSVGGLSAQLLAGILAIGLWLSASPALAQDDEPPPPPAGEEQNMDAIEQLFTKEEETLVIDDSKSAPPKDEKEIKGVADLATLSEFKDVAIIQKRFLPKTKRFEAYGGVNGILNDKFFSSFGLNARLGYSFSERYGIELVTFLLTTTERQVTSDLRDRRGVTTTNFVTPKSYYGLDFKWTPVYGKMTWLNKRITPFDLYFSGGMGMTNTNQGRSEPTFHLGTGQIFAITKSSAFRWDFSWNFYSATSGVTGATQSGSYNNLLITLGASFFFPEATYR